MSVKPFSDSLWKQILTSLDDKIRETPGPHCAAFDADGTLWDSDVGENFFQYQIDHCRLPALNGLDPWAHYKALKASHPPSAYLWLAQICNNYPIDIVRSWAAEAVKKFPPLIFESQKKLIAELTAREVQVYVVSASVQWAVEAAMPLVGLSMASAMGVKTKVINSLVSLEQDGPITWRAGKAEALLLKTEKAPIFCSGNTSGDQQLLECSQGLKLAIQTQAENSQHPLLLADEQQLLKLAMQKKWLQHHF